MAIQVIAMFSSKTGLPRFARNDVLAKLFVIIIPLGHSLEFLKEQGV